MLGLKRGTVALCPHQASWEETAQDTILLLKDLLPYVAVDIKHVGSTAIRNVCAKPIIDIAIGVRSLEDIKPHTSLLARHGVVFRKEDVSEQLLFVIGDQKNEIRTHHIHVVQWNGPAWNNYINFRDYLNTFPEYAKEYDSLKKALAAEYADDRGVYTAGKHDLIDRLLKQAALWRESNSKNR